MRNILRCQLKVLMLNFAKFLLAEIVLSIYFEWYVYSSAIPGLDNFYIQRRNGRSRFAQ